ncbi:MAG TPA: zinc ribbon domain-containing protein [Candidatus Limnocylindrales bacterium]
MICPNCGFQNAAGDEFCGSCGHFLAWKGSESPADTSALPPPSTPTPTPTPTPAAAAAPPELTGLTPVPPPSGTYNPGINWPAGLQRCDVCGTANELSRTFCLNCGARLKRAGTTTGTALAVAAAQDQRRREYRMIGYALGGALLFVVFAAGAFIVLGGLSPGRPIVPTPPSSTFIAGSPGLSPSSAPGGSPAGTPVPGTPVASVEPLPTPAESLPEVTTPPTVPPASVPPATLPPAGGFVCAPSTFNASVPAGWQIFQAHWSRKGDFDSLTLEMHPAPSGSTASVGANILPPDQVETTYGIAGPASGNVAVVLSFNNAVSLTGSFGAHIGYKALQEFQITRKSGLVYAVIGVNGSGCYGLTSDAWSSGLTSAPELVVSLQR